MALTSKGIWTPDTGDNYNLIPDLATMAGTIDTALDSAVRPNLLINSNFRVNQRGAVSGTSLAAGTYFLDRWYSGTASNAVSWTGGGTVGTVTVTIPSGGSIVQKVEAVNIRSGSYTISWGGTALCTVIENGTSLVTQQSSPVTFSLSGAYDVSVYFVTSGSAVTLSTPKMERGSIATSYSSPRYDQELAACRRYYYRMGSPAANTRYGLGYATSTTQAYIDIRFNTQMRTTPTVEWNDLRLAGNSGTSAVTSVAGLALDLEGKTLTVGSSGLSSGAVYMLLANTVNSSYLGFDSEL